MFPSIRLDLIPVDQLEERPALVQHRLIQLKPVYHVLLYRLVVLNQSPIYISTKATNKSHFVKLENGALVQLGESLDLRAVARLHVDLVEDEILRRHQPNFDGRLLEANVLRLGKQTARLN